MKRQKRIRNAGIASVVAGMAPLESGVSVKRYCAEAWLVADGILRVVDFDIAGFDN